MRELSSFIIELTKHTPQQMYNAKIQKELIAIKKLFISGKLYSSDVKIPIAKLTYFAINGQNIDFGLQQIIILLNSHKISNVRIGYLAASLIFQHTSMSSAEIIPIVKQHLMNYSNDILQSVALSFAASIFEDDQIKELAPLIAEIVICQSASEYTRKKAILILARVTKKAILDSVLDLISPVLEFYFVEKSNLRLASSTLILTLLTMNPQVFPWVFDAALKQLVKLFVEQSEGQDVIYYGTPSPWYARQCLRILKMKISWNEESKKLLELVALAIFSRTGVTVPIREAYSYLMVLSELMGVIAMVTLSIDTMELCAETVAKHLKTNRVNVLFFALDSLMQLIQTTPKLISCIQGSKLDLYSAMKSPDNGVAKIAVALLEKLGNKDNCHEIVNEIMNYFPAAPLEVRKVLCTSVAKLINEFATEPDFFVTTMISLLTNAGAFCKDEIWRVTAKKIAENESLRETAIEQMLSFIFKTPNPPEPLMKLAVYVCGEYASNQKLKVVLDLFISRFDVSSPLIQAFIITAITKICTRHPEILNPTVAFLSKAIPSPFTEVAQRARESFCVLNQTPRSGVIFSSIPNNFTENDCSSLLDRIKGIQEKKNTKMQPSHFNPDDISQIMCDDEHDDVEEEEEEQISPEEQRRRAMEMYYENLRRQFTQFNQGRIYQDTFMFVDACANYLDKGRAKVSLLIGNKSYIKLEEIKIITQKTENFVTSPTKYENSVLPNCQLDCEILIVKKKNFKGMPQMLIEYSIGSGQNKVANIFIPVLSEKFN